MAILMMLLPYRQCISFLFFVLPITCGIPGYSMLVAYIIVLLKSKQLNLWQTLPPLCIMLLEFAHMIGYSFNVSLSAAFSFFSFVLVFFYLLFNQDNRISIVECIKLFVISAIIASGIVLLKLILSYGIEELMLGYLRGGVQSSAQDQQMIGQFDLNANSMAFYSIVSFSCLLIGQKNLNISRFLYVSLLILSVAIGIISFSRTYTIVLALALLLYFISKRNNTSTMIIGSILVCALLYAIPLLFEQLLDIYIERFASGNFETAGGRTEVFQAYHNAFINNPNLYLGGTGVVNYAAVIGYPLSIHCGFQQLYVCCGLIGISVFILSALHYKRKFVTRGLPILFYIPLIASVAFDQSIQFFNPYFLMLPFIPVAYVLRLQNC